MVEIPVRSGMDCLKLCVFFTAAVKRSRAEMLRLGPGSALQPSGDVSGYFGLGLASVLQILIRRHYGRNP